MWVRFGASPDPAQCGKPTALGTPFLFISMFNSGRLTAQHF